MGKRDRTLQATEQPLPIEETCQSLIKKLASCKQTIRDRSLRTILHTWLPNQTEIPDENMKKLWQGIFYCMWHADKSLYQSELIERLSAPIQSLPIATSLHYFTVFLFTMRREWSRIDRLRLDKFYLLIRKFVHALFKLIDSNEWEVEFTCKLMSVLFDESLLANDMLNANGVNYHIVNVFVEEVKSFLPLRKEVLEVLFVPFVEVLGVVNDKVLVGKIKSCVFDELLKNGKKFIDVRKSGLECKEDDDVVVLGSIALCMEFSKRFYEIGSGSDCNQGNRKVIFALHEEFLQLEKDLSVSGIEVSIPVAKLAKPVTVFVEAVANGSSSSSSKKTKKGLKKCSKIKSVKKDDDVSVKEEEGNDESMISDLRMEFEKIASEMGPVTDEVASVCEEAEPVVVSSAKKSKKRKRENKGEKQSTEAVEKSAAIGPSGEKSLKRVRFAMKNNLVWKPHCPLPPQDLRLPPSATPRGSALKKGIPAGPVREAQIRKTKKKVKPTARRVKTIKKKMSP